MSQTVLNRARVQGGAAAGGFVLALSALFVAMAAALILLGAQAYEAMAATTRATAAQRTAVGYVLNRVCAYDQTGALTLSRVKIGAQTCDVLILDEEIDGRAYQTRLFCADGVLREQFCQADAPLTEAQDGAEIVPLVGFEVQMHQNRLTLTFTYEGGGSDCVTAALHAAQEGFR